MFHVHLADDGKRVRRARRPSCARAASRSGSDVFWAVALNDAIDRETVELFRSKEMLARKERDARTAGRDRRSSPRRSVASGATRTSCAGCSRGACLVGQRLLPRQRPQPGRSRRRRRQGRRRRSSAQVAARGLRPLQGGRRQDGRREEGHRRALHRREPAGPPAGLREPRPRSATRRARPSSTPRAARSRRCSTGSRSAPNYGETASGRFLADEFAKEPFGWDFEVVRLLVLSLLRAGKIEATSKGQTIDSATGVEARDTFSNNNLFRQASFRPKKGIEFAELVKASEAFSDTFGSEVQRAQRTAPSSRELREEVERHEDSVSRRSRTLIAHRLPGADGARRRRSSQMKAILRGSEDNAIRTFNASHTLDQGRDQARRRARAGARPSRSLHDLERARAGARGQRGRSSTRSPTSTDELREHAAAELEDLLARETFFRELPTIEQHARAIEPSTSAATPRRSTTRVAAYKEALDELMKTPGWARARRGPAAQASPRPLERGRTPTAPTRRRSRCCATETDACARRASRRRSRRCCASIDGERVVTRRASAATSPAASRPRSSSRRRSTGIREECARLIGAGKKVIVAVGATMDKDTRNAIERATQRARKLLEEEFAAQLEGTFDVLPRRHASPRRPGAHLIADSSVSSASKIVAAIEHKRAAGMSAAEAVADYLRDAAFTTLNRFVALKMLEARELVQECITRGRAVRGLSRVLRPGARRSRCFPTAGLPPLHREPVRRALDRGEGPLRPARSGVRALADARRRSTQLLEILNAPELAGVWGEDETIGWVYQFFNSGDERKKMRDESQAPRNSRELAVRNQFFTPRYVVQFLVDNTLGRTWCEMHGERHAARRAVRVPRAADDEPIALAAEEGSARPPDPRPGLRLRPLPALRVRPAPDDLRGGLGGRGAGAASQLTGRTLREDYPDLDEPAGALPGADPRAQPLRRRHRPACAQIAALALWLRAQRAYRRT